MELKQFVHSDYCLKCVGCCSFLENPTIWAPQGFRLVKTNDGYRCEHLKEENNCCAIYSQRPLDCRLYPFLLVRKCGNLHLGLHKSCCFVEEKQPASADIQAYAQYLKNRLNAASLISAIRENPEIAADYQENVELITDLKYIFAKAYLPKLNKLTLKDKPLIEGYLLKSKTSLSAYHFADIFIWKDLFQIFWLILEDELCIFYHDKIGMFMMLPPLGKFKPAVVMKCFEIMNAYNSDSPVSRIENAAREDISKYSRLGLSSKLKDGEYLCLRKDLIELAGKGFKSKRSGYNYFVKNHKADFLEYKDSCYLDCLKLYQYWSRQRKEGHGDVIYQQMLEDSFLSFQTALRYYKKLGLRGYVVRLRSPQAAKINGKIKACTFGYSLNKETFCVLFEICDFNFKGIAQYVFREFCKKLSGYKYINIMGASDLENLKTVKLSYHPKKEIGVYNIYQ